MSVCYRHAHLRAPTICTLGPQLGRVNDLAGASRLGRVAPGSGSRAEVFRSDVVEELADILHFIFLLVRYRDAGLVEYVVVGEDGGPGAERQGNRVRGPGADRGAVREDEVSEEDPVSQGRDVDLPQLDLQRGQDVPHQVMSERTSRNHALLSERDGRCLHRSDPDREVTLAAGLFQQHDGLVRWHLDADADDLHLLHRDSVLLVGPCTVVPRWHGSLLLALFILASTDLSRYVLTPLRRRALPSQRTPLDLLARHLRRWLGTFHRLTVTAGSRFPGY